MFLADLSHFKLAKKDGIKKILNHPIDCPRLIFFGNIVMFFVMPQNIYN